MLAILYFLLVVEGYRSAQRSRLSRLGLGVGLLATPAIVWAVLGHIGVVNDPKSSMPFAVVVIAYSALFFGLVLVAIANFREARRS